MKEEVRIPNIGDADEVYVIELCVAPGDAVGPDDALVVIESDKASMEVPAGVGAWSMPCSWRLTTRWWRDRP